MGDRADVELVSARVLGFGLARAVLTRVAMRCRGGGAAVGVVVAGCKDDAAGSVLPCGGVETGSTCMGEGVFATRGDGACATANMWTRRGLGAVMTTVCWRRRVEDDRIVADAGARWRRTWRRRCCPEREQILNEDDVTRGVDSPRGYVVAPVATVIAGVANEVTGD